MSCVGTPHLHSRGTGPPATACPDTHTTYTCTHSLNLHIYQDAGTIITPILQIEKLWQRQISNLPKATYT